MGDRLKSYHYEWLRAHPSRTEGWLLERMADGFHIHHLDGDHENNDQKNLVLIEMADHLMLHNGGTRVAYVSGVGKRKDKAKLSRAEGVKVELIGRRAWEERVLRLRQWGDIAKLVGCGPDKAKRLAVAFAEQNGKLMK